MSRGRALVALLATGLAAGCGHEHGPQADHDHPAAHDDELAARTITAWTERLELFVEHPPLIVGAEAEFLAHVTVLDGFTPLRDGLVTVTLTMAAGPSQVATADRPTRPGIFVPALVPARAGACSLTVEVRVAGTSERIEAGACQVFADRASAEAAAGETAEPRGEVAFLKEQQWAIAFATAPVGERELQPGVRLNAEIRPVPDRAARLTAPTAGRLVLATPAPVIGTSVKKGQLLANLEPAAAASASYGGLQAEVEAAEVELAAATAQRDRLARLAAAEVVPARRLEEAEAEAKVARARLEAAKARLASYHSSAGGGATTSRGAFRVRSPIAGTLVEARVTSGETVNAGDDLFTVIDLDRVWVSGRIFEADLSKIDEAPGGWFQVEGRDQVFSLGADGGRLVTIGSVIDPKTRTVPVIFEVDNRARVLRIGQFATLTLATGAPVAAVAVPESALLQEGGQWAVYVQVTGESFERRVVQVGIRSRGWVEVRSGVSAGQRVVTTGAYDVRLSASTGSAPGHGHSH